MEEQIPTCSPGGSHTRAGGCPQEAVTPRGPRLGQRVPEGLHPRGDPRWGRAGCEDPPHEGEAAAATAWEGLAAAPAPSCAAGEEEVEKIQSKIKPKRKGGGGEGVCKIWVYFLIILL